MFESVKLCIADDEMHCGPCWTHAKQLQMIRNPVPAAVDDAFTKCRLMPWFTTKLALTMPLDRAAVEIPKTTAAAKEWVLKRLSAVRESKAKTASVYTAE